jgi:SAM-dependent methyltransferase
MVDWSESTGGTRHWDAVGEEWAQENRDRLWRVHSDAVNAQLLLAWLPTRRFGRVLKTDLFDEVAGEGLVVKLRERCDEIIGVDISSITVRASMAANPDLAAASADVRHLPFADESFDVVVSNSTLDHFDTVGEITEALGELHRVLRAGGTLLLTLDNPLNPIVALRNAMPIRWQRRSGLVPYFVGVTLGPWKLERTLREIGFDITDRTALLHCPRVVAVRTAARLQTKAGDVARARFLRRLMRWEVLAQLPTRYFTGHFSAVLAVRRDRRAASE